MKVVNHKISMMRGETPTYSANIKMAEDIPYIILKTDDIVQPTFVVEFVIRPTIYSKGDDFLFRRYIQVQAQLNNGDLVDIPRFESRTVIDREGDPDWEIIQDGEVEGYLYRQLIGNIYEYRYLLDGEWQKYNFNIGVVFPYSETKDFEPKIYWYEINLLSGELLNPVPTSMTECPITVINKTIILPPREFKVEASIGV